MSENDQKTNGASERSLMLQRLYVKDVSLEVPNSPDIFNDQKQQETQLNLRNSHRPVNEGQFEVVLHISVHAKAGETTLFLIELEQAGLFLFKGYSDEEVRTLLGTYCPNTLFPFARETVATLVGKGGFPPLVLQPINFDALFARAEQERAQQHKAPATRQ